MTIHEDLDVQATVFWFDVPHQPPQGGSYTGGNRSFETVRNAVRFVMETIPSHQRGSVTITTDYGMNYDIKDIESAYAALSSPSTSPAIGPTRAEDRERIIRAAWEERGKALWNPDTHGRGLLSLHIPSKVEARPVRFGQPLPPYDDLEFRLVRATMGNETVNSIVCENVVVETIRTPIPPSTGGMKSDDKASQAAQTAATNRRRIVAEISSGPTFVPPPQERVTFRDSEAVTDWVKRQPEDVAVVFAARGPPRCSDDYIFSLATRR